MTTASTPAAIDAATGVAVGCLDRIDAGRAPLVVDEPSGTLAAALAATGSQPSIWCRRADNGTAARDWPAADAATSAFVRLPKEKASLDMALHASAALLPAGAPIVVFGTNEEGIRSAARHMQPLAADPVTLDARRHARVWVGQRHATIAGLKPTLDDWRQTIEIDIGGKPRDWVTYPGLFARGRIDEGTALLLAHLPEASKLPASSPILDLACGTGIIAAEITARGFPHALHLVDIDAVAITASRVNVPGSQAFVGDGLAAAPAPRYAMIISNPPIHVGVAESHAFLHALAREAAMRLVGGGVLQIVVQRRIQAQTVLADHLATAEIVADDGRFQILRATGRRAAVSRRAAR